jgi:hypothetical protein
MKPNWASVDAQMGEVKLLHQDMEHVIPKIGANLFSKHSCQKKHCDRKIAQQCKNQVSYHADSPKKLRHHEFPNWA